MPKRVRFLPCISYFCTFCLIIFIACKNKIGEGNPTLHHADEIIKNKVCSVTCLDDTTQSYALYIPQTIDTIKNHQAIVFFDSHARGWIPVKKYRQVADNYQAILVGSVNIKNNIPGESLNTIFSCLANDLLARFGIKPTNITLAGFSGGGRIASILAAENNQIASVLSCAAGLAKTGIEMPEVSYAFIGGQYDFNFTELLQATTYLDNKGIKNQLFTFESGHEWPPESTFNEAILWTALKNAKKSHFKNIKSHLLEFIQVKTSLEKKYLQQNDTVKLYEFYNFLGRFLSPAKIGKEYLQKSQNYAYDLEYYFNLENKKRLQYQKDFFNKDGSWWEDEIGILLSENTSLLEERVNRRVLSFISLMGYMHLSKIIATGDIEKIQNFLNIYEHADPENPDVYLFKAKFSLLEKNAEQALFYLNKAVEFGLDDVNKLKDPGFLILKNSAEYNNILLRVSEKNSFPSCY